MSHPLVSIITPSCNRAGFIEDTIRSVSAQSYPHIEHIVIDGASTDGTVDILEAHARAGALRYLSEPDKGMYDAINKGLTHAQGDILCYLNTDDRYLPWSVEAAVRSLADHGDVDIVYGDTIVLDLDRNRQTINILPTFSSAWLRSGGIIPQPTVFFRRRVYQAIGSFQREVKYLADCEYWLRADRAGMRIAKLHEFLAVETNHAGTIRQSLTEALAAERRLLVDSYADPQFKRPWARMLLHRLKYAEKELLMMGFALDHRPDLEARVRVRWPRFRAAYKTDMNVPRYYAEKLLRIKSEVWRLEERHG